MKIGAFAICLAAPATVGAAVAQDTTINDHARGRVADMSDSGAPSVDAIHLEGRAGGEACTHTFALDMVACEIDVCVTGIGLCETEFHQ